MAIVRDVIVRSEDGEILIEQRDYGSEFPSSITISPDQVDLFIQHIKQAAKDCENHA